jgi:hypothetical protein
MKSQKFLHVRIPYDFHQQLVKYAEDRFISVSSVVLQSVAKTIGYTPKKATPRTYQDYTPVVVQPPQPPIPDEDGLIPDLGELDESDWDMEDLQRRAAAAPPKPM